MRLKAFFLICTDLTTMTFSHPWQATSVFMLAGILTSALLSNRFPTFASDRVRAALLKMPYSVWFLGSVAILASWLVRRRRLQQPICCGATLASETEVELALKSGLSRVPPRGVLSKGFLEPGVFGLFTQILVWSSIVFHALSEAEQKAILAYEMGHLRRRDNLTASIQMVVEVLSWFHLLVCWLGHQVLSERERACDEEVLSQGRLRETYAQSILKISELCVGSLPQCAAGITGRNLGDRLERVMSGNEPSILSASTRISISTAVVLLIVTPLALGMQAGSSSHEQLVSPASLAGLPIFEVSTIKRNRAPAEGGRIMFSQTGLRTTATTLLDLIKLAYGVEPNQVSGLSGAVLKNTYDVEAKVASDVNLEKLTPLQRRLMVQPLLAERFNLKVHAESKRLPAYVLVVGKGGSKLIEDPPGKSGTEEQQAVRMVGRGHLVARGIPMEGVLRVLSDQLERPVIDGTGLTKHYDFSLVWTPDDQASESAEDTGQQRKGAASLEDGEKGSLFTAVQEQLGLKLEKQKGSVESLVVDHFEKPSTN